MPITSSHLAYQLASASEVPIDLCFQGDEPGEMADSSFSVSVFRRSDELLPRIQIEHVPPLLKRHLVQFALFLPFDSSYTITILDGGGVSLAKISKANFVTKH